MTSMRAVATRIGLNSLLTLILAWLMVIVPSSIEEEGRVFPVIKNFSVVSKGVGVNDTLQLFVKYDKIRNCKSAHVQVELQDEHGAWVPAAILYPDELGGVPRNSAIGPVVSHWRIEVPADRQNSYLFARFHYRCWGDLLWETKTSIVANLSEVAIQ